MSLYVFRTLNDTFLFIYIITTDFFVSEVTKPHKRYLPVKTSDRRDHKVPFGTQFTIQWYLAIPSASLVHRDIDIGEVL